MKGKMKIFKKVFVIVVSIFVTVSCNYKKISEWELNQYLNDKEVEYELICNKAGLEVWNFYSDTTQNSMKQYKQNFSKFYKDDTLKNNISQWSKKLEEIKNDTLKKRIELWQNIITCAQVDFDPEIIQLQDSLEIQLAEYPSEKYKEQEIELNVKQLIALRNNAAKRLGYSNYAFMILQTTGVDTLWFEKLVDIIDNATLPKYNEFVDTLKKRNGTDSIEYDDIVEFIIKSYQLSDFPNIDADKVDELLNITLQNIGLDISKMPIQFKITELPPGIGGFGNCIDIPNDFRVVVKKELSFRYILHEIGHGLNRTNIKTKSPILKGYEWSTGNSADTYSEAMAEVIGKFSQNSFWLKKNGHLESQIDSLNQLRKDLSPFLLRMNLIYSLFEIELYKNPKKDAAEIKNELYKKYLLIDKDFSKKPNLIMLQYVSYPVYEQNYLIADIISWQIHDYLSENFGKEYAFNKNVGKFLIENCWKDGELYDWRDRVKRSTGKDLDLEGYLKNLMD
jgi:hypothetical protein